LHVLGRERLTNEARRDAFIVTVAERRAVADVSRNELSGRVGANAGNAGYALNAAIARTTDHAPRRANGAIIGEFEAYTVAVWLAGLAALAKRDGTLWRSFCHANPLLPIAVPRCALGVGYTEGATEASASIAKWLATRGRNRIAREGTVATCWIADWHAQRALWLRFARPACRDANGVTELAATPHAVGAICNAESLGG